jgi:hypothetical protein
VRYKGVKKLTLKLNKGNNGFSYSSKHFYSKTKHWDYEKEYRIVLSKKFNNWISLGYPFDFLHIVPFSKESIHSIILGAKIEIENEKLISKIIQNNNSSITLYKHSFDF